MKIHLGLLIFLFLTACESVIDDLEPATNQTKGIPEQGDIDSFLSKNLSGAKTYYVAPNGNGNGSDSLPWGFNQGLNQADTTHPNVINPGDTIKVTAGTYEGNFIIDLIGSASKYVIVDFEPGAKIDANSNVGNVIVLTLRGQYNRIFNAIVTNSNSDSTGISKKPGVSFASGKNVEFINGEVYNHSTTGVYMSWMMDGGYLYGTEIYDNGFVENGANKGPGIYVQNDSTNGQKLIEHCYIHNNTGVGIQFQGSQANLSNIKVWHNVIANNELYELSIGGTPPSSDIKIDDNIIFDDLYNFYYGRGANQYETYRSKGNYYFGGGAGLVGNWDNETWTNNKSDYTIPGYSTTTVTQLTKNHYNKYGAENLRAVYSGGVLTVTYW